MAAEAVWNEVATFLASPAAFGEDGPVQRIDTHFSAVFLGRDRVLKLKRPVVNDLLDYSTVERRRDACRAEVTINRRTAPGLYLDAQPVTRGADGGLRMGGDGEALDWVVVMRRFDDEGLFLHLAEHGGLTDALLDRAADAVARLHASAKPTPERGGLVDMAWVVDGNLQDIAACTPGVFEPEAVARLERLTRTALDLAAPLLESRRIAGRTRRCHGDLHLANICLVDGVPTLFDAIEFNDRIACCDPLYDLAFLVMDLWHRDHRRHANRVLNRWLWRSADWHSLPLLPLFLSCRATVRAKTSAWAAEVQQSQAEARDLRDEATAYLQLALACLEHPVPGLLAIGGLSGSGKTSLALELAAEQPGIPGAVIVRSDVLRKQRAGVDFEARLDESHYSAAVTAEIYGAVVASCETALSAGLSAIADAVYLTADERGAIESVSAARGARFDGLWLEAPAASLKARVENRAGDASDANARIVARQLSHDPGQHNWTRVDSGGPPGSTAALARRVLLEAHEGSRGVTASSCVKSEKTDAWGGTFMNLAKILVAASGTAEGRAALETAFLLAKRFSAHVEAINVRRNPRDAVAFMTEGMTGAVIEEIIATAEQDIDRRAHQAEGDLRGIADRVGIPVTSHPVAGELSVTFRIEEGREDEVVAERGRLSDLVVAARPTADGDAKEEVVAESVLMESGSGLLLVPAGHVSDLSGNAAIAWNGSAEAARAVHRAMPLLVNAKEVAIMAPQEGSMRGPGPEALAAYLALHGIHCHVHNLPTTWTDIGHTLLEIAHQEGAAFIVMGAFSQGKLRQLILGGATRFMLNHSDLPVLFTH